MNKHMTTQNPGPIIQCVGLTILLAATGMALLGLPVSFAFLVGGFIELLGWLIMLKA